MSSESTTASTKKWQNPKASHTKSRFLQLPAELQLIILRKLLVTETPLGDRETYLKPVQATHNLRRTGRATKNPFATTKTELRQVDVEGYYLYPQVLATCQELCDLGRKVLYAENRFVVEFKFLGKGSQPTGGDVWIPAISRDKVGQLADIRLCHGQLLTVDISDTARAFALRFDRYLLYCWRTPGPTWNGPPTVSDMSGFLVLADLASIFSGKDLIADHTTGPPGPPVHGHAPYSGIADEFMSVAKVFQALRCKAFEFQAQDSSAPASDLREALQDMNDMERVLFAMMRYDDVRKSLVAARTRDLLQAMYRFDVQNFKDNRDVIMEVSKEESGKMQSISARDDEVVTQYIEAAAGVPDGMDETKLK